ncbi:hypothetical protein [Bradyrhizobium prioriisuperbiae]|uniref:hypothetical protein n=1 Tax=Bradyrhizobium prioriisuperbiae TaxID=2854389 RepID=UPI0028EE291A|nr:hypothetical protein [Bradyrhizobium prioritasuperba]
MTDAKADCQSLMNSVLPFAEQTLSRHGEFLPFGGAKTIDGEFISIADADDGQEHPPSGDLIRLIKDGLREAAGKGEVRATALVYDVRTIVPSTGEPSDAIAVSMNHRDGYSVTVMVPYKIGNGTIEFGQAYAQTGEADIFPPAATAGTD